MKAVILAGGLGTRLAEETALKPKPMVEIGGKPILWHIMKNYSVHGISEFVICLGYKGYLIKEYFANYFLHMSDVSIDIAANQFEFHGSRSEPWKVTLVDTGESSNTAERLRRVGHYLKDESAFCFTYGDGLTDANIRETIDFHSSHKRMATLTSVVPQTRYGSLQTDGNLVTRFTEKPVQMEVRVNGGFFVLNREVLDLIEVGNQSWEANILPELANSEQLMAYQHDGFWQSMDTIRDKELLESLWESGKAPWKTWN